LDRGAQVEIGNRVFRLEPEETVFIPRRTPHRLSSLSDRPIRILEISIGDFDENDIVRLEDVYGRVKTDKIA
jgi:mannose-6-phosphate isomerase